MLDDAPWQQYRMFCTHCRKWRHDIQHTDCPEGSRGSLLLIDIAGWRKGCRKCQQSWPIETVAFYCRCGHAQPVEYVREIPPLQHGDKVIRTDGDLSWVQAKTHAVVVGMLSR